MNSKPRCRTRGRLQLIRKMVLATYNYCPEPQCLVGDWKRAAFETCTTRTGSQCKLFADGKDIVWRGPVYVLGERVSGAVSGGPEADSRRHVHATYRINRDGKNGAWFGGQFRMSAQRGRQSFDGSMSLGRAGKLACSGSIDLPKSGDEPGNGQTLEGAVEGLCTESGGSKAKHRFQGSVQLTDTLKGNNQAVNRSAHLLEFAFSPE